ncbi:hypothetical protein QP917_10370 [Corynebacterium pseudodiphtheriticum]|uniref:hypothetical protein n=1 Tax=Corynebacterium pseudodiphtheriticum TaxID=37637 RepID=UPI00254E3BC7|nr:hypothetical protein [Corynebacterium pseudodiphtheriticum]MDK8584824.1 hypothetical protein [Corynebacterium pseudodiphtheriticum]MDK8840529.1 hypothetical protein [Corynebacterium pseudodiphtheriticum]
MNSPYGFVKERDLFEWLVDKVSAPQDAVEDAKVDNEFSYPDIALATLFNTIKAPLAREVVDVVDHFITDQIRDALWVRFYYEAVDRFGIAGDNAST